MQIEEHKAKLLTKEILEEYINNTKINFNFYGISDNLLFIIKDDKMAVFDLNTNEYIIPYTKSLLKSFKEKDTGNKIIAYGSSSHIDKIGYHFINKCCEIFIMSTHDIRLNYLRFDELGRKKSFGKCTVDSYQFFTPNVRYFYDTDKYKREEVLIEENLVYDDKFDYIYPSKIIDHFAIYDYNNEYAELITNDKWDAQSHYEKGLSIIYKDGLYGVCDTNYKVLFDYDSNINYISIVSSNILLLKNKDNLLSLYDTNTGYIIPFKYQFDSVTILSEEVFKVKQDKKESKYRYVLNNKISTKEYDNVSYDIGVIILKDGSKIIFMDMNENILFEKEIDDYQKSSSDIYYQENGKIIKHNLHSGEEITISVDILCDENNILNNYNIDSILRKYKYYFIDNKGKITLFRNMKYGVSIDSGNGIKVYRWYDDFKNVYRFQEELLNSLMDMSENNKTKVLKK